LRVRAEACARTDSSSEGTRKLRTFGHKDSPPINCTLWVAATRAAPGPALPERDEDAFAGAVEGDVVDELAHVRLGELVGGAVLVLQQHVLAVAGQHDFGGAAGRGLGHGAALVAVAMQRLDHHRDAVAPLEVREGLDAQLGLGAATASTPNHKPDATHAGHGDEDREDKSRHAKRLREESKEPRITRERARQP
jgi:hypothetical protein